MNKHLPRALEPTPANQSVADPLDELERDTEADRGFVELLDRLGISLIASLRPGLIGCFGARNGELTASFTRILAPMGVGTDGSRLAVATKREIVVYAPSTRLAPHAPGRKGRHDAVFVPVLTYRTGDCMAHDMILDGPSVVFTNTQFSCLSRADGFASFVSLWKPPFISALLPEDRCHLNSFAMAGGRVRFATAFAPCDAPRGYRDMPIDSGVIIDVEANAVLATGLIKPHSVRLFDDMLYVLNSAAGEVLEVDIASRGGRRLATLPGFTRGLRAHGDVLFVGLSELRQSAKSLDLPLASRGDSLITGIAALDRRRGRVLGILRVPDDLEELLDFVIIPGIRQGLVLDAAADAPDVGIETPTGSYLMSAVGQ